MKEPWRKNEQTDHLLREEWLEIDCTVNTSDRATLSTPKVNLTVDNKKIMMPRWNVFNITNLTIYDEGIYYCHVCGMSKKAAKLLLAEGEILKVSYLLIHQSMASLAVIANV